jgi:glycosyltransferase involved in cell wall biosynthesis
LRSALEQEVKSAGLKDDVWFLGHTDRVAAVMAAADRVVLLSKAEGLPQVLVQAAATATPFVCYPVDGAQELLARGAGGAVAPFGDAAAAAVEAAALIRSGSRSDAIELREWDVNAVALRLRELLPRLIEGTAQVANVVSFAPASETEERELQRAA